MILSDRGLDRRIQEMGLGNNMIQGIFSWKGNEGWTQSSEIMTFFSLFLFNSWQQKIYNFHPNINVKQQPHCRLPPPPPDVYPDKIDESSLITSPPHPRPIN